ncbi:hypothetical protein LJR034_006837 [Caballeronia sp. LjRoot34]|uniref:hypothetical protein n=1 Tax=Caballeronia sp. LjRoot34 TaxID=3342325 RepID=UPI003ED14EC8
MLPERHLAHVVAALGIEASIYTLPENLDLLTFSSAITSAARSLTGIARTKIIRGVDLSCDQSSPRVDRPFVAVKRLMAIRVP